MKFKVNIVFWGDVFIVALESIMSQQGDIHSVQYQNVRLATVDIIKFMQKNGFTKEMLQTSVAKILEIRHAFVNSKFSSITSVELVPATLVALCIKNTVDEEIDDDVFGELITEAYSYLSKYSYK